MRGLAPLRLVGRLGSGGMAEVWEAERGDARVAVKVISAALVQGDDHHATFANEVRAMARLRHPFVVRVLDHGRTGAGDGSDARWREGAPYLVMELAQHGSASAWCGRIDWPHLRALLAMALEALAHAHARGVLHRDIKPSNMLLFGDGSVRLSDFGVADELVGLGDGLRRLLGPGAGTPSYMAPEQFGRARHDIGPWTDLYALGCTAYALACGDPPFGRSDDMGAMAAAHRHERPPPLFARTALPAGFDAWTEKLLAKDPRDRFRDAPEALRALRACDAETAAHPIPAPPAVAHRAPQPPPSGAALAPAATAPSRAAVVVGAAMALHWLRSHPLVGREAEQDELWALLERARTERQTQVAILRGASGCGKSALARWLCEQALEAGVAEVLRAVHEPFAGGAHGLSPMVARWLRATELSRDARASHLRRVLEALGPPDADDAERDALVDLAGVDEPRGFSAASERHTLLSRLLQRIARDDRAVVVWLDDAHWGADALAFARHCAGVAGLAALVVVTVDDDALPERPAETKLLGALAEVARVLSIGPLPPAAQRALVADLAPLHPEVVDAIVDHTAGSPLFAEQLVGHWIDDGTLAPDAGGRLRRAGEAVPAADVAAMWRERLARVLAGASADDARALELAAVLGLHPNDTEWRALCDLAGLTVRGGLLERLLESGMAWRVPGAGWSFAHAGARQALLDRAAANGRLAEHHLRCAALLAGGWPHAEERRARHLLAAGDPSAEADRLLWARARTRAATGDLDLAEALLEEREAALRAGGCPSHDLRWGDGWILHARLQQRRGRLADAARVAERVRAAARRHGWVSVEARAELLLAEIAGERDDLETATQRLDAAERLASDAEILGECLLLRGTILAARGALAEADASLARADALLARAGAHALAAAALAARARVSWAAGDPAQALERARAARARSFEAQDRYGVGRCLVIMGDAAQLAGKPADAVDYYERGLRRLEPIGARAASANARGKLGLAWLALGDAARADTALQAALATSAKLEAPRDRAWLQAALVWAAAAAGRWPALDAHLDTLAPGDLPLAAAGWLERGAALAQAAGERARAARALAMAAKVGRAGPSSLF